MVDEDGIEYKDQYGYRSLWEMLEGPVRDTVRARSLPDLEKPEGYLNVLAVG